MLPLQVLTVLLVALVMGLALAHALELPGKLRLRREEYLVTQTIYYPGFTIGGGVSEVLGIITTLVLVLVTPRSNPAFWWTVVAFLAITAAHVVFWVITQPMNRYWVSQLKLPGAAQHFFSVDAGEQRTERLPERWEVLRNRWEYSHITRAILAGVGLLALTVAVAIYRTG